MSRRKLLTGFVLFIFFVGCRQTNQDEKALPYPSLDIQRKEQSAKPGVEPYRVLDSTYLVKIFSSLASDSCEGRQPGTPGHEKAATIISAQFREIGMDSINGSLVQGFTGKEINGQTAGRNIIGLINGTRQPETIIVITAHYDHLGKLDTAIFNGADDNASGVAALVALAKNFKAKGHPYTLLFAAVDREEHGLEGAYALVDNLKSLSILSKVVVNINLDMIARSDKNELFITGIGHYPAWKSVIDSLKYKVNVQLLMGHDDRSTGDDWTNASDHAAFHANSIPFIYIGVEDHADYHATSDKFEKVDKSRYVENSNVAALLLDLISRR